MTDTTVDHHYVGDDCPGGHEGEITVADLTRMPLRIELQRGMVFRGGDLIQKSFATISELPDSPRKKAKTLWGPISPAGNDDASWSELLRVIASAFDADTAPSEHEPTAAPEMRTALLNLIAWAVRVTRHEPGITEDTAAIADAQAALDKVEGRA